MVTLVPDFDRCSMDDEVCVVGKMLVYDHSANRHLLKSMPGEILFRYQGSLPCGMRAYSFMHVLLKTKSPTVWLESGPDSKVLSFDPHTWDSLHGVVELCCGIGAMGCGSLGSGFFPQIGVDSNPHMVKLWETTHGRTGICSDICDPRTVVKIWEM